MNSPIFFIESAVIGIAVLTALNHSAHSLVSRKREVHLLFVVLALAICVFSIGNLWGYSTDSVASMLASYRWRDTGSWVFIGALPWFVASFTGRRSLPVLIVYSVVIATLMTISVFSPYGTFFAGKPALESLQLPWGESVTVAKNQGSYLFYFGYVMLFLAVAYTLFASYWEYRRGRRKPALALLVSTCLFLVAVALDFMAYIDRFDFVYVGGWGFLGFTATMSFYVSDQLFRSYRREKDHEMQLHEILDNADVVVYLKDSKGVYRLVNRRFEELFGIKQVLISGKTAFDIFPPENAERLQKNDEQVYRSGVTLEFRDKVIINDREHVFRTIKFPLRGSEGEIVGLCGISTDITEHVHLQDEVARQADALATFNTELEAFSYSVAHDLRSPLNAIHGFSQLLMMKLRNRLDEESQGFLQSIIESSGHMNDMLTALAKLASISRGKLEKELIDLTAMARNCAAYLQQLEPNREVKVTVQEGLVAEGQAELLGIMLNNLLGNAWKYTSQVADPHVEVGAILKGGRTTYFVKDNGAGFDMALQDQLFLPFQRLHAEGEFEGTGFGLSIVRRVVDHHGGRIWAESQPGQGATFFFQL